MFAIVGHAASVTVWDSRLTRQLWSARAQSLQCHVPLRCQWASVTFTRNLDPVLFSACPRILPPVLRISQKKTRRGKERKGKKEGRAGKKENWEGTWRLGHKQVEVWRTIDDPARRTASRLLPILPDRVHICQRNRYSLTGGSGSPKPPTMASYSGLIFLKIRWQISEVGLNHLPMRTTRSSRCISAAMNSQRPSNDLNDAQKTLISGCLQTDWCFRSTKRNGCWSAQDVGLLCSR